MAKVYSVSKVNAYIKNMFALDFALSNLSIEGEISNCKYHSAGHIYFTLKDEKSQISAIMFAGKRSSGLKVKLYDGMKVVVTGSIEVYEKGGSYQIYASSIEEAGLGNLYERYLELKNKLETMGLFDNAHKKAVPRYALNIGIVTSPTGAAIQDIINVSKRRNPYVKLVLYPALVQGEGAAGSVAEGIKKLDEMQLDVIIIGRGGGSMEDLWAFNDEKLAHTIFNAKTPVISAVGHETDFTISDFVSDLRAATPSQAAEIANFDYLSFLDTVNTAKLRMKTAMRNKLTVFDNRFKAYKIKIAAYSPERKINQCKTRLADIQNRMERRFDVKLTDAKSRLSVLAARLENLSPVKRIAQGYAYISDMDGNRISKLADVKEGDLINLQFKDGKAKARLTELEYKQILSEE